MKTLLTFLCLAVGACNGPSTVTLADGTIIQHTGHLGGKRAVAYKRTAAGTVSYMEKTDNGDSFREGVTAGVAAIGAWQMGLTQRAEDAAAASVSIGAQKAATSQAGIAAGVEKARIGADLQKAITIPH